MASNVVDDSAPRGTESQKTWLWAVAVVVFTLGVYLPSLGGPFIWDDHYLIVNASNVTRLAPLGSYFDGSFWQRDDLSPGEHTYYRPLTIISFALDHVVHGNNPGGFHLSNVCLHAATALVLFAMLGRRGMGPIPAFVAALAWAWFPRLTEATAWISGRTDVLAALFTLLGLWFYERDRALMRWLGALSLLAGLLCKEVALAGVLAAVTWSWSAPNTPARARARALRALPALLAAAVYAGLRLLAVGPGLQSQQLTWSTRALHGLEAVGRYAYMLLDAWRPGVQLGTVGDVSWPYVALGAALVLIVAALLLYFRPRLVAADRPIVVLGAVSLGLVLHLVPVPVMVVAADRFLYLPTLALALFVAPRITVLLRGKPAVWSFALGAYVLSFAPATWLRTRVWSDEVLFWTNVFDEQAKNNALSRLELGNLYSRGGLFSRAALLLMSADEGDYTMFLLARNNAGGNLTTSGEPDKAVQVLEDLVLRAPGTPKFRVTLAFAYSSLGRVEDAKRSVDAALALLPNYPSALDYKRRLTEREPFNLALSYPDTVDGQLARAQAATKYDRIAEAVRALLRASELGPLPPSEWTPALLFMFDSASFSQLETMFTRYRQQQTPDPVLLENFAARAERVARLRALWPTLLPRIEAQRVSVAR